MNARMSRRSFSRNTAIASLLGVNGFLPHGAHALPGLSGESGPPEKQFMDQYYDGIIDIVTGIRASQVDAIAGAMEKAYELKQKGGTLYSHVVYGHFTRFAGSSDRPGQPWILPQSVNHPTPEEFDGMKEGDFLITSAVNENTMAVRDRGVYVVGVTNNYFRFRRTPPGGLRPDRMKLSLEEMTGHIIDSQVPWNNGLIAAPQVPNFRLCPSTGIASMLVYWSCTASLATLIGTKGRGSSAAPVRRYLDMAEERFRMIGADRPKIDRVAEMWADRVLGRKARLLVYGHPQNVNTYGPTSSNNMFVNDAVICASSSMIAEPYTVAAGTLTPDDIVLIGAFTSDNTDEITVARHARNMGALTTAFCPYATDGDSSGARLFKEVDIAFNSYSDESAGVIEAEGFPEKVSPLSGVTGNLIHWMLTAQWADHMARRGEMPYFWQGYHENGGKEYDDMVHPYFLERGY